ncbi:MAG TPA: hypothetical protein VGP94_12765, partial [Tepidisphaeraceae bacterium]|nr:hypothetical protein [Tepidisphaeraceae bacterium]
IRDPDLSLGGAILTGWRLLLPAALNFAMVGLLAFVGAPELVLWAMLSVVVLFTLFGFYCIWQRWRTPSLVRIGHGRIFLRSRKGSKVSEHEWDVREVRDIETSHGSSTFHSFYSIRIHLNDGSKVPFLHCMNGREGQWLLNFMKMVIANEQGAMAVQEGLAPALQISLPPPPLPAMGARVAAMEEQMIRTAPPALPDSQSGWTSNQNRG